ncbi:O-methyltransferase [Usnea florida]
MDIDFSTISRQIETLSKCSPEAIQDALSPNDARELRRNLNKLSVALESPGDIVDRIVFHQPVDLVAIRLAVDLGLFKALGDSQEPKSIQQLADATGADATLLGRILRCLASIDAIAEAGHEMYTATKISRAFTTPKGISGAGFFIDLLVPSWANLPANLAKSHYQNPINNLDTGLQAGLKIDYHGFEFLAKNPKIFNDFNIFMSAQREGRAYWLDFYPFEQKLPAEARDSDHDVLFVDVGGALGSEILELRKRFPALKGRMILQELPQTIEHVSPDPGMEATVHDFFTPQPVTGAHIYYLRNVLHDWPDPLARLVLQQISSAMTPGVSRLLINELVVPVRGCGQFAPHSDFNMMSICAGMERTEAQWKELLGSVGLEIRGIWTGDGDTESIIEAVPAGPTQ